jgi:hypothetical protein
MPPFHNLFGDSTQEGGRITINRVSQESEHQASHKVRDHGAKTRPTDRLAAHLIPFLAPLTHRRRRPLQPLPPSQIAAGHSNPSTAPCPPVYQIDAASLRSSSGEACRIHSAHRFIQQKQGRRGLQSSRRRLVSSPAAPRTTGRWPCSRGPGGGRPSRGSCRHGRPARRDRASRRPEGRMHGKGRHGGRPGGLLPEVLPAAAAAGHHYFLLLPPQPATCP